MELTLNIDIEAAIQAALSPEKIGPAVDKAVSGCVNSAVREVFGYGGAVYRQLEEQFAGLIPHGLNEGDAARFQVVLQNTIRETVVGTNAEAVRLAITQSVNEIIGTEDKALKLSDLLRFYKESLHDDAAEFHAQLEENAYGGYHLSLNGAPLKGYQSKYSCETRLAITEDGRVYSLFHKNEHFTPATFPHAAINEFDVATLSLYVGRRHLVIDMSADEVEDFARRGGGHD